MLWSSRDRPPKVYLCQQLKEPKPEQTASKRWYALMDGTSGNRNFFEAKCHVYGSCEVCQQQLQRNQTSSARCYNGSTLLGIRADKVTHEWINDCKKPTEPPAETSQADVNVLFQNIVQEKQIEIAGTGLWMPPARWSFPQWQQHCVCGAAVSGGLLLQVMSEKKTTRHQRNRPWKAALCQDAVLESLHKTPVFEIIQNTGGSKEHRTISMKCQCVQRESVLSG